MCDQKSLRPEILVKLSVNFWLKQFHHLRSFSVVHFFCSKLFLRQRMAILARAMQILVNINMKILVIIWLILKFVKLVQWNYLISNENNIFGWKLYVSVKILVRLKFLFWWNFTSLSWYFHFWSFKKFFVSVAHWYFNYTGFWNEVRVAGDRQSGSKNLRRSSSWW